MIDLSSDDNRKQSTDSNHFRGKCQQTLYSIKKAPPPLLVDVRWVFLSEGAHPFQRLLSGSSRKCRSTSLFTYYGQVEAGMVASGVVTARGWSSDAGRGLTWAHSKEHPESENTRSLRQRAKTSYRWGFRRETNRLSLPGNHGETCE